MNKLNRKIDEQKVNESKSRTIDFVMNEINSSSRRSFRFSLRKNILVSALSLFVLTLVSIFAFDIFDGGTINPPTTVKLTTFESEKLAELSYISGRLFVANFSMKENSIMKLSDTDKTEFENNIDEFNTYFDMLKVFLDNDEFSNDVIIEVIENSDYDTSISFNVDGKMYTFLVKVIDEKISGELTINNQTLVVEGKYSESDNELKLELLANNGSDYIKINYKTETVDEIEKKYEIEQFIDGVLTTKEIKISIESDEQKVEIKENDNSYELKKEKEGSLVVFKLFYEIDDQKGEVEIHETIDNTGTTIYSYKISEGEKYKEIDLDDPDEDEEEEENDEDEEEEQSNHYNKNNNKSIV